MAIDQRQIADIQSLKPEFVMDPITAATPPSIGIAWNNSDKKYHISLKLPQFVIDGSGTSTTSGGGGAPPLVDDPPDTLPADDPPVVTVTTVDSSNLSLKSYGPFFEDSTYHTITADMINNFDSNIMELSGELRERDEGEYEIEIYLKDSDRYKWSDSSLEPDDPVILTWTIGPPRELADYTPEEIVAKVRSGEASSIWHVGDRIPITFENRFKLTSSDSSYIESGTYDAVVLGFDHNVANETSNVSHNMAFAIMYRHDSDQATCLYSKTLYSLNFYSILSAMCANIYNALPTSWQNVIISTKKTFYQRDLAFDEGSLKTKEQKVFLLSPYEVGISTAVVPSEYSPNNKQKRYEHFSFGFPASVKPVNSNNYDIIVASRSSVSDDAAVILLNQTGKAKYTYSSTESDSSKVWRYYTPNVMIVDKLGSGMTNYLDAYNFDNVTFGIIPCFTIG